MLLLLDVRIRPFLASAEQNGADFQKSSLSVAPNRALGAARRKIPQPPLHFEAPFRRPEWLARRRAEREGGTWVVTPPS